MAAPLEPHFFDLCRIKQDDRLLTCYKNFAVTTNPMPDQRDIWRLAPLEGNPMVLTLSLMPDPNIPIIQEQLLTLSKDPAPGMKLPILIEPRMTGAGKRQYWTLHDLKVTKRLPLLFTARIVSEEVPALVAATSEGMAADLPNPFKYVEAVPPGMPETNGVWQFDYLLQNQ